MFGKRSSQLARWVRHIIDSGSVGCPRRQADVDIEQCFMCPAYEDLVTQDGVPYLVCRST